MLWCAVGVRSRLCVRSTTILRGYGDSANILVCGGREVREVDALRRRPLLLSIVLYSIDPRPARVGLFIVDTALFLDYGSCDTFEASLFLCVLAKSTAGTLRVLDSST